MTPARPEAVEPAFYRQGPAWMLYPLLALASVATVIASQAVISGAFSVPRQAMQPGFLSRFEVKHTSKKERGQVYLPGINWGLFCALAILAFGFRSSPNIAAAYGIAVSFYKTRTSPASSNWDASRPVGSLGIATQVGIQVFRVPAGFRRSPG